MVTESKKTEILKHISIYSFATQLTQLITAVAAVLSRHFLGPLQMGIWSILQIVLEYSKYTTFGISDATGREIPYWIGKQDLKKAGDVKNIVASFALISGLLTSLGILAYAVVKRESLEPRLFWGLVLISVIVFLQRINNLFIALIRAFKKFDLASHQMILSAIVNVILVAVLAYRYHFYGFIFATGFSLLFNIFYIRIYHRFNFSFALNKTVWNLIAFGFPLMLIGAVDGVLSSIDRIVVVKTLGLEAMGFYSVAVMASSFLKSVPNAMGVVMIPHLHEKYGTRDNAQDLKGYIHHAVTAFSNIMPLVIGSSWIVAPFFIRLVLPQYINGIDAAKFLLLSSYFFALGLPYSNFIIATKRHLLLFPVMAVVVAAGVGVNLMAVRLGWGIAGVAVGTTFNFFFNYLLLLLISTPLLYGFKEAQIQFLKVTAKFAFLIGVLLLLDKFVRLDAPLIETTVKLVFFWCLQTPFLYHLYKQVDILPWKTVKKQPLVTAGVN